MIPIGISLSPTAVFNSLLADTFLIFLRPFGIAGVAV